MSLLVQSSPFGRQVSLQCPLTLESFHGRPNPNLTRFAFSPCNEAQLRLELIDRILGELENCQEPPPWYDDELKQFNFEIITHRFNVPHSIGADAPLERRLIHQGVFNLDGLHGGYYPVYRRYLYNEQKCPYRCDERVTRLFQSTYLNRMLRFGDLEYTWPRAAIWVGEDIIEIIEPLAEGAEQVYEAFFGKGGEALKELKRALYSFRPFIQDLRKALEHFFFYTVAFKAILTALNHFGVQSAEKWLLKVNERIDTLMYCAAISFFVESFYTLFESDQYRVILDVVSVICFTHFGFKRVLKSGVTVLVIATLILPQVLGVLRARRLRSS